MHYALLFIFLLPLTIRSIDTQETNTEKIEIYNLAQAQLEHIKGATKQPQDLQYLLNLLFFGHKKIIHMAKANQCISEIIPILGEHQATGELRITDAMLNSDMEQVERHISLSRQAEGHWLDLMKDIEEHNHPSKLIYDDIAAMKYCFTTDYCNKNKEHIHKQYLTTAHYINNHRKALKKIAGAFIILSNDDDDADDNEEYKKIQESSKLLYKFAQTAHSLINSTQQKDFNTKVLIKTSLLDAVLYEKLYAFMQQEGHQEYQKTVPNEWGILKNPSQELPEKII